MTPTDLEAVESLRERGRIAPESFSTAGPELAYEYWAATAHQDVSDVRVTSPAPCDIDVRVLLAGGVIPDPDGPEIAAVRDTLTALSVRPEGDRVAVSPPEAVRASAVVRWYATQAKAPILDAIGQAVAAAAEAYRVWQTTVIGRDIVEDKLRALCGDAGARRIEVDWSGVALTRGVYIIEREQVAAFDSLTVVFGGIEDE